MRSLSRTTLRWRWPLQHRQSAGSLASRLAALNGRLLPDFLMDMSISARGLDLGAPQSVRDLGAAGGVDPAELARWTPRRVDRDGFFEIGTERLHRLSLTRTYFRYCPQCVLTDLGSFEGPLAARPWMRLEWTIGHVRTCPEHDLPLVPCHPKRRRFSPFDFNGALQEKLETMEGLGKALPTVHHSLFQDWLIRRLEGERQPGVWLDALSLHVAVAFCEALGVSALHEPKVRTGTFHELDWAAAADAGYDIASAGTEAIEGLLERLARNQGDTRGVWGARDTFGYVYGLLSKHADDAAWAVPRDLVAGFTMRTLPLKVGSVVLGHVVQRQAVHTIWSAAKTSGAHALTIRRLFERESLAPEGMERGLMDHRVTIDANEIQETLQKLTDALSTSEALRRTGFPRLYLRTAIADGHLPTVTGSEKRRYGKHRFEAGAVAGLMDAMFEGSVVVSFPAENMVDITTAQSKAVTTRSRMLRMIYDRELTWKGRLADAEGFGALLLDADEVTRLVRSEPRGDGISMEEILDYIPGLAKGSAKTLLRQGLLASVEQFSPDARRMVPVITRDSADAFLSDYVTLGEALSQRPASPQEGSPPAERSFREGGYAVRTGRVLHLLPQAGQGGRGRHSRLLELLQKACAGCISVV
ncbi:TniQ family protein [Jiella pelagia]|uniref:TniQ family protein n=1 Tax=Jiella pelagia TaxID=2986949 RepID=A0ABY7C2Y9_9HYPH|nr:TniQ family protein [Jiella pelagia]WAP70073.1 TniQ family protein [Jiella pelagia]